MDRRLLRSNGRVAHVSLAGQVEAAQFSAGDPMRVSAIVADLTSASGGRERQLLRGEAFTGLDTKDGRVFGFAEKDGYCGWIAGEDLAGLPSEPLTHRIASGRSYAKSTPGLKTPGAVTPLPHGIALAVLDEADGWARVAWTRGATDRDLFVPFAHLAPLDAPDTDPASVAERYLGTPYLWGGNSAFGIDCSGLVQAALLACAIPCPGDSDQQMSLGAEVTGPLARGDLVFWKGHVAMVADATRILHANAHHMAVAYEDTEAAIARIAAQGDGEVLARRRVRPA